MFELRKYRGVMALKIDSKFKGKLTCASKIDMRNLAKFSQEHLKVSKLLLRWHPFVQSRKYMSLKFTRELCVMTMKNDAQIEEELTCQFKIDRRNLTNFDLSTQKSKKFAF